MISEMTTRTKRFCVLQAATFFAGVLFAVGALSESAQHKPSKLPRSNRYVENTTFVAFDTETTGFSPKKDRLVELGAVKFKDGEIIEERTWLINPKRSIPYWAQEVHGITYEMVKDKPVFEDVYPEFLAFIDGCVLVAHNAPFDLRFLREEIQRNNLEYPRNITIDSLRLFRAWYPDLSSHKLGDLAEYTKVDGGTFHRATDDSRYIFLIFENGIKKQNRQLRLSDLYKTSGGGLEF